MLTLIGTVGNTEYQKQYRDYVKYRHLLANMPKPSAKDKQEYENMETRYLTIFLVAKLLYKFSVHGLFNGL